MRMPTWHHPPGSRSFRCQSQASCLVRHPRRRHLPGLSRALSTIHADTFMSHRSILAEVNAKVGIAGRCNQYITCVCR